MGNKNRFWQGVRAEPVPPTYPSDPAHVWTDKAPKIDLNLRVKSQLTEAEKGDHHSQPNLVYHEGLEYIIWVGE